MGLVRHLVTEEEFLALPETTERIELVDGEVIVSPSPSVWHQDLLIRIGAALKVWSASRSGKDFVGVAPLDVRLAPQRILQPDVFVIPGGVPLDHEGPIDLVPALCVEVVSTNRTYDRVTKRLLYAAAGVAEYWVVEPAGLVERWHGSGLGEHEELVDRLSSPLLPGFALDLGALFRR